MKEFICKGQIKPKADWPAIDCPKKRTNEFVLSGNKISSFKYFWTDKQKNKQICLFVFWENLWRANLFTVLSDL